MGARSGMNSNGVVAQNGKPTPGPQKETMRIEPYSFASFAVDPLDCIEWPIPEVDAAGRSIAPRQPGADFAGPEVAFARRLEEETRRSFEAGRERGRAEAYEAGFTAGREAERASHQAAGASADADQAAHRAALLERLVSDFAVERARYFERAEREIVKLALAVAARILRRESQMDPLLLLGAVRVALGQLDSTTTSRLRVPAAEADLWREAASLLPNHTPRPAVIGDGEMRLGDCVLETGLGSVDLGVRAQLAEIERGFFDRAPAAASHRESDPEPAAERK